MNDDRKYLVYHGLLLPKETHNEDSLMYAAELQIRDDDIFVLTYPKSGTTWMQEILPLLLNGGDLTPVETIPNWDRVPWLEETRAALVLKNQTLPRAMVSHLPYNLMPRTFFTSKAKVIYITRNPKDVVVSSFYFHKMASFLDDPGTFDEFLDKFLSGQVLFGKWTDHVKSWRNTDLGDRILYINYEDLVKDLTGALCKISQFLGRKHTPEILQKVAMHCSFSNMKNNSMSNYSLVPQDIMDRSKSSFMRKGIVGDWKNHFSPEQEEKFTTILKEEMKGTSFKLD
ncbi:sulfotransferase family 2, cytosolic sulfotransferase 3 [Paramormyrops kingsleyae]|uniref:Sulfotransferase n=1 Tax=Paramormyrops kingsleyae TaxID=1676925 RepID=A0A3B3QYC5_9TELE|nr:sulfotransferase family cytosolic 2B member 1-like [Paramormyrops kingsleyae]